MGFVLGGKRKRGDLKVKVVVGRLLLKKERKKARMHRTPSAHDADLSAYEKSSSQRHRAEVSAFPVSGEVSSRVSVD